MRQKILIPEVGSILIRSPLDFRDKEYETQKRAIILISQSGQNGSIGFILNKPTPLRVHEAFEDFPQFNAPLFWGGPDNYQGVYYFHNISKLEDKREIKKGFYWGGNFNQLKEMIAEGEVTPDQIKFCAGYYALHPKLLRVRTKKQIKVLQNKWRIAKFNEDLILNPDSSDAWGRAMASIGSAFQVINDFDEDVCMN